MVTETNELEKVKPYPDAELIHALEIEENQKIAERLRDVWANQQSHAEGDW